MVFQTAHLPELGGQFLLKRILDRVGVKANRLDLFFDHRDIMLVAVTNGDHSMTAI